MEPQKQEILPETKKVTIQYESWIDLILDQNSPVSEASQLIEECLAETEGMARMEFLEVIAEKTSRKQKKAAIKEKQRLEKLGKKIRLLIKKEKSGLDRCKARQARRKEIADRMALACRNYSWGKPAKPVKTVATKYVAPKPPICKFCGKAHW